MAKRILLGITTLSETWKNKFDEVDGLDLKEAALFPTNLNIEQRKVFYNLLEKTGLQEAPHVHVRDDFEIWELDYLTKKFKTQVFNLHFYPNISAFFGSMNKYSSRIYIENTHDITLDFGQTLPQCGGICLDISHWEDWGTRQATPGYELLPSLLKKFKIGCNHISAIKPEAEFFTDYLTGKMVKCFGRHHLDDFSELDYIKKYTNFLSDYISIELENTLSEQMEIKKYLEKIINL